MEGFPSTAGGAVGHDQDAYVKILVMEGYYDLATPFAAALDHGPSRPRPQSRQNISYATYNSGHMVYVDRAEHDKMKKDVVDFMEKCLPK